MPPTAPETVLPPATGGSPPASPVAVLPGASGGSTPTAPGRVQPVATPASPNQLTTAFAGANNDLRFTQLTEAVPTIRFVMSNSIASPTGVTVAGNAITVTLMRNLGAFYLTAADVKGIIEASAAAMSLVSVAHAPGNDGSGAVCQPNTTDISFGPTALSGGSVLPPPVAVLPPGTSAGAPTAPQPII